MNCAQNRVQTTYMSKKKRHPDFQIYSNFKQESFVIFNSIICMLYVIKIHVWGWSTYLMQADS